MPNAVLRPVAPTSSSSVQVQCKVNGLVGDCAPLGYFDPFGFSKDASPETMKK